VKIYETLFLGSIVVIGSCIIYKLGERSGKKKTSKIYDTCLKQTTDILNRATASIHLKYDEETYLNGKP
jgi:hypothetical protein